MSGQERISCKSCHWNVQCCWCTVKDRKMFEDDCCERYNSEEFKKVDKQEGESVPVGFQALTVYELRVLILRYLSNDDVKELYDWLGDYADNRAIIAKEERAKIVDEFVEEVEKFKNQFSNPNAIALSIEDIRGIAKEYKEKVV